MTSKTAARAWAQKEIKKGRIARGHKLVETYLVVVRGHLTNHVLPYFKDKRLAQISSRHIEDWILKLRRERLSPATINHALRGLKVMLKEAARHGIISRDPSAYIAGRSSTRRPSARSGAGIASTSR
jgi:site-specific recombinase XerD